MAALEMVVMSAQEPDLSALEHLSAQEHLSALEMSAKDHRLHLLVEMSAQMLTLEMVVMSAQKFQFYFRNPAEMSAKALVLRPVEMPVEALAVTLALLFQAIRQSYTPSFFLAQNLQCPPNPIRSQLELFR
jgi:hypothetical protein